MRCDLHCPKPGGPGISAGGVAVLAGVVVYLVNRQAIDHAALVVVDVAVITLAGLALALVLTVAVLVGLRFRPARRVPALRLVRSRAVRGSESQPAALSGRPVARALPAADKRTPGRSGLRSGQTRPGAGVRRVR